MQATCSSRSRLARLCRALAAFLALLVGANFCRAQLVQLAARKQPQNSSAKSFYPSVRPLPEMLGPSAQQQVAGGQTAAGAAEQLNQSSLSTAMLKTFVRTNKLRVYHLDLHSYRPDARFSGDPEFVDSRDVLHVARCRRHLERFRQVLASFKGSDPVLAGQPVDWLRLADAFGRPESGILMGNQFWLGSYAGCLNFRLAQLAPPPPPLGLERAGAASKPNSSIQANYCLGVAQFPNWNPADSKTSIKVGLCLPETCTSSMLNEQADLLRITESMMKYQFGDSTPFSALKLRQVYCLPHRTSQVRQYSTSGRAFLLVAGSFLAACLLATASDYIGSRLPAPEQDNEQSGHRKSRVAIVVESFSLIRNFKTIMSVRRDTSGATPEEELEHKTGAHFDKSTFLSSMAGLKCIGLFWIVGAHTFLVSPIPSKNVLVTDTLTKTYLADIYLTAHLMVDTFFTLSGVLAAYFLFKTGIKNISTRDWLVLSLHRYWRLTPIYLLCYWYTKSVGFLTSGGPLWDYQTAEQSPRLNCARESWLQAILHLSDFKSPKDHCVPFAWFIANGIKFWMVTPFFIILINRSVRRGYATTISFIVLNCLLVTVLAMKSNVDIKSVIEFKPESADNMLNNMGEVYSRPYSRIGTYLIGLLAGHLMYLLDTNQLQARLSKDANTFIWTLVSLLVLALTFVLKIAGGLKLDDVAMPWIFSISSALIRPLWALCTCWFVFALSQGQVKWMAKFLSADCWQVLVRLSFCAYLAQGEVIAQLYLSAEYADSFSYVDMISRPLITIVLTLAVSLAMVLVFEYPLNGLERLLLPERSRKKLVTQTKASSEEDSRQQKTAPVATLETETKDKRMTIKLKAS